MSPWKALAVAGGLVLLAAVAGSVGGGSPQSVRLRYQALDKPDFAPPARVFGPAWGALYPIVALAGARVMAAEPSPERSRALAAWGSQLALNAAWSPLFFGRRAERAALADIAGVIALTTAFALSARKVDGPAAALTVPYLGWLGFAAALNAGIVQRQRGRPIDG